MILHLYYYEEYSIREIADLLHMKENTVSSRLARGRDKLKQIFQKGGKEYEFQRELPRGNKQNPETI